MSKRKCKKRKSPMKNFLRFSGIMFVLLVIYGIMYITCAKKGMGLGMMGKIFPTKKIGKLEVSEMFLTKNEYSRPGTKLKWVNGIVIHYTANPGTTARNNRDYFEGLKDSKETSASSHFIIGLHGEVIQCIPLNEIAYASNKRNKDTISIECCHPDESGKFNDATYDSLVKLTAWLCGKYNLKQDNIIRHYDVTGKICPKYFVEHEDAWKRLKEDVFTYIDKKHT